MRNNQDHINVINKSIIDIKNTASELRNILDQYGPERFFLKRDEVIYLTRKIWWHALSIEKKDILIRIKYFKSFFKEFKIGLEESLVLYNDFINYLSELANLKELVGNDGVILQPKKINYLLIDDESEILEILCEFLVSDFGNGHNKANDGEQGLQLTLKNHYDFIITDYLMPKKNGIDFISHLRSEHNINKNTPIILLTGFPDITVQNKKVIEDVFILDKPIDKVRLNYYIRCLLLRTRQNQVR